MRDLLILGAGVHAGEMVEIVERINSVTHTWILRGMVSSTENQTRQTELNQCPVMTPAEAFKRFPKAALVPDNSWPRTSDIQPKRLITLIDPSAWVSRTATIGRGGVIYPGCYVGLNARIGDYLFCLSNTIINHDDTLGRNVCLASGVILAGNVTVEDDCYLGQGCMVRQSLRIGANSMVGMGAVVVKDVPPRAVMAGNPARKIKDT